MPSRYKIMINALTVRPGGGLTVIYAMAKQLSLKGYNVLVMVTADDTAEMLEKKLAENEVVKIRKIGGKALVDRVFLSRLKMLFVAIREDYKTIISLNALPFPFFYNIVYHVNLLRFQKKPKGSSSWGMGLNFLRDFETRLALRFADVNLFESNFLLSAARNTGSINNPKVIHLGLEEKKVSYVNRPLSSQILMVTSPQPHKNNPVAIRVLKQLKNAHPGVNWRLVIAGGHSDADWSAVQSMDEYQQLKENIEWVGYLGKQELVGYYRESLCLLSASTVESFCMVALEAMQFGCPSIVMDAAAMPESVGDAGIILPPGDEETISQKIVQLYDDQNYRNERSQSSIEKANTMTWGSFGEKLTDVVRSHCDY